MNCPGPTWTAAHSATVPGTVGTQQAVRLAHPEPLTVPRFLPVQRSNYGVITPAPLRA
jgi:hypothetical protein